MLLTTNNQTTAIYPIVARSRSLAERLSLASTSDVVDFDDKIAERLKKWCQIVAQGDFAKFEKRLAWAGLNIQTIRPLLADTDENESQPLPTWAIVLEAVIKKAQALSHKQILGQSYLDNQEPVPFEQIYIPCLQVAKEKLLAQSKNLNLLSEPVRAALERQLLLQLNDLCFATLMSEFSAFRLLGNTTRDFLLSNIVNSGSHEKYDAFVQKLFADGLQSLFLKYSVLGKLIATKINLWVEATGEFCDRLATNWLEIEQKFSPEQALKQVATIKTGLSDPHNGGRTVMILTFDTGTKVVYKPKDIGIDVAYFQLLDWFNCQNALLPFKILQVLNCGTHGWVEYVEQLPCDDLAAAKRFYQRAGILLCLVHLLEGTDCHSENVVANGEHLVLIDLETLLHHRIKNPSQLDVNAVKLAEIQLNRSVLQTLILPKWGLSAEDSLTIDLSALGGTEEQELIVSKVQKVNTDGMYVGSESHIAKQANVPKLEGKALNPQGYLSDIVLGFRRMYDFLGSHQEVLLASDSPLMNLAAQKVRYVFRATRIYQTILNKSFAPDLLQSGIDRSIGLDVLSRAFLLKDNKPDFWSILAAELGAMEQLDIPFFATDTSQASLDLSRETIPELFEEASFATVISRLKSLNQDDLERQVEIIRGSFCIRFITEPEYIISANKEDSSFLPERIPLTSEQLVQEAITLAEELRQRGIYADDDSVSWIGLGLRNNCQDFQLQSLSHNLYDGSSGVALFLAALAKVTGDSDWRDLALNALQPLLHDLRDLNPKTIKELTRLGLGGAMGLGSIIYALVQISYLLRDADLIEDAKIVANLITPDLIKSDELRSPAVRDFDLMSGAAGTILACLKLYEVEPSALEPAIACGEHLLEHQDSVSGHLRTGLSQGAAGIAYALLRLFEVTQDSRFLTAAKTAISYEQNWQGSNSKKAAFHNSWANGAAGIGLARLGGLSILDRSAIRQEINFAIAITQQHCLEDVDNLAWGNLGRIETLLVASQKLNHPDLFDFGLQATAHIVKEAQARGRFNLVSASVPKAYNPGFFQGTTGIGYQLLRIAHPNVLPSILLWE